MDINIEDNKNNGLITKIWGQAMWESLHCIAFGYPIEPTDEQKRFSRWVNHKAIFKTINYSDYR